MWSKGKIFYLKVRAQKFAFFGIMPLGLVDFMIDDILDLLYLFPYKWSKQGIIPLDLVATYMNEVRSEAPLDLVNIKSNDKGEKVDIRISLF